MVSSCIRGTVIIKWGSGDWILGGGGYQTLSAVMYGLRFGFVGSGFRAYDSGFGVQV